MTKPKNATKKKSAGKSKLDTAMLEKLSGQLASFPRGVPDDIIANLEANHGLKKTETPKGSGMLVIQMAGIKTKPVPTMQQALTNWANKARREIARVVA